MKIEEGCFRVTRDGQKVGPMQRTGSDTFPWTDGKRSWTNDGSYNRNGFNHPLDLVSEWTDEPTGPVRTVTRKVIVEGAYDRVRVLGVRSDAPGIVGVRLTVQQRGGNIADMTAPELRAAAATFIALAEALEDGK